MGKTLERRFFTSSGALRYRRKAPAPADNQQLEPQQSPDIKQEPKQQEQLKPQQQQQQRTSTSTRSRSSRSPPGRRFRPKPRQPKQQSQQQPALLKQLLWKAKAVQPAALTQQQESHNNEEEEEEAFAKEQRRARKLLASEAEALAATKSKAATATAVPSPSESFVAESSSQETQSGSEDEAVFLPYSKLNVQSKWQVFKEQEDEETDGEETASPVLPSETMEKAATRRKQRQKYKLKQKQKRAAAKEQKRLQHQQKQQENEQLRPTEDDAGSTLDDDSATVNIFHPPTDLTSKMDAGVCRAVLSQLKEVVPFIVVGDVACPMVSDDQHIESARVSSTDEAGSEDAIVDFRQHVVAMLDRSKETQMQYRESFVVENSGFDAASSYDFFKRRFCEIQGGAGIVYY